MSRLFGGEGGACVVSPGSTEVRKYDKAFIRVCGWAHCWICVFAALRVSVYPSLWVLGTGVLRQCVFVALLSCASPAWPDRAGVLCTEPLVASRPYGLSSLTPSPLRCCALCLPPGDRPAAHPRRAGLGAPFDTAEPARRIGREDGVSDDRLVWRAGLACCSLHRITPFSSSRSARAVHAGVLAAVFEP